MRKLGASVVLAIVLVMAGAVPSAVAAGASISPNTQTTTGTGSAHWTLTWSGGSGRWYQDWNSTSWKPATSSMSGSFDSCPGTHTVTQELDVVSGTTTVAAATSKTTVKQTNPC